eukprot:1156977-Pelagomonas_calceolata.AAC.3
MELRLERIYAQCQDPAAIVLKVSPPCLLLQPGRSMPCLADELAGTFWHLGTRMEEFDSMGKKKLQRFYQHTSRDRRWPIARHRV